MERYMMILKSIRRMNPELEQALLENVYPITVPKQAVLHARPGINDNIYFIEKGLFHYYYLKSGTQVSIEFRCEDQFIHLLESFNGRERDPELHIEALENSTLWCIPGTLVRDLYGKYIRFSIQYLEITTRDYLAGMIAADCSRPGEAASNFKSLCFGFSHLLHRVPLKYLSNFTQIPEKELQHLLESPIKLNTYTKRRRRSRPKDAM